MSPVLNPLRAINEIYQFRYLIGQLVKRDVLLRYRGAFFGVLWVFLAPLIMLVVFAYVFGQIFQSRWPATEGEIPFWLMLYCGLIVFNLFAETVSRSPNAVRSYPSYVKKVIFPLHILPLVPTGAALVHAAFNFGIFVCALLWFDALHLEVFLIPVVIIPVLFFATGLSWFLAAWGVFIKDMTQIVPIFVQLMMFLSPVFYPVSAVPAALRPLYQNNPLSVVIEVSRSLVVGHPVEWSGWLVVLLTSILASMLGYAFFKHSRDEFADVL